ncbi:MAG: hypothetical protein AVDCRST_MAG33-1095 [uncultured Thermomicrobiales bacterium]|uniref:Uncharacterized protein n=1 Tax=uncultured Thermomicrobiales bacterium TaxID=1645740 RepID=A0A6J4UKP4_9BACT|nr:MAG: hypothetical protein AVDCRST_MAG33-1095 [uncultured Thermomicrobiales bacterium]
MPEDPRVDSLESGPGMTRDVWRASGRASGSIVRDVALGRDETIPERLVALIGLGMPV